MEAEKPQDGTITRPMAIKAIEKLGGVPNMISLAPQGDCFEWFPVNFGESKPIIFLWNPISFFSTQCQHGGMA